MTVTVNVHEAKTHFSRLLERVRLGEEIIVAKAGKPVARLVPLAGAKMPRTPRSARGRVVIAPDFDARLPEETLAVFER